jgi:type II secretory pathway pseudopilin PulG
MYHRAHKERGLTLIEMTLVVATIALLVGFGMPAVRSMMRSLQTEGGTRSMINAALNSARTMAMSQQRYVGIRFQKRCTSNDPTNPLKGLVDAPQYVIFIVNDSKGTGLANGFRAVEGMEPIKLPDTTIVMDMRFGVLDMGMSAVTMGWDHDYALNDATTFSIVFSPAGKLVTHRVRVRNHDGVYQPKNDTGSTKISHDDVFNSVDNICLYREGMFIQDDYSRQNLPGKDGIDLGLKEEDSATQFITCDTATFRVLYEAKDNGGKAQVDLMSYLNTQNTKQPVYVNVYTGQLIMSN